MLAFGNSKWKQSYTSFHNSAKQYDIAWHYFACKQQRLPRVNLMMKGPEQAHRRDQQVIGLSLLIICVICGLMLATLSLCHSNASASWQ